MRIKFISNRSRDLFFKEAFVNGNFLKWRDFYEKFDLNRKALDSYRKGKLTIPGVVYNKICTYSHVCGNNLIYVEDYWGRVIGGKEAYKKNIESFNNGRVKAIKNSQKAAMERINLNLNLSSELAYFLGLFIGDGFTNKYGRYYVIQFTGHLSETKYYREIVTKITDNIFHMIPKIRKDKYSNAIRVELFSKALFLLITERFNISAGRKSYSVLIPEEIVKSQFVLDCIAGIFDAEGCSYFDTRGKYKEKYPCINLHMNNSGLVKQISDILNQNNIPHSTSKGYANVFIYGKNNVEMFYRKIQLKNPKIKDKLDILYSDQ